MGGEDVMIVTTAKKVRHWVFYISFQLSLLLSFFILSYF